MNDHSNSIKGKVNNSGAIQAEKTVVTPSTGARTKNTGAVLPQNNKIERTSNRPPRRLYVGNLPPGITDENLLGIFYYQMYHAGMCLSEGNPVLACQVNSNKNYAFIELRSIEETTMALAFNVTSFRDDVLKISRPSDYQPT